MAIWTLKPFVFCSNARNSAGSFSAEMCILHNPKSHLRYFHAFSQRQAASLLGEQFGLNVRRGASSLVPKQPQNKSSGFTGCGKTRANLHLWRCFERARF
jgi:hypothetical protein